jgi:hypothetical protein
MSKNLAMSIENVNKNVASFVLTGQQAFTISCMAVG